MKGTREKVSKIFVLLITLCVIAVCSISVSAASFHVNATKITLYKGQSYQLKASATGVKWSSKKKEIATVNASGLIKAKKAGKTTIIAKANGEIVKCTVTVKAPTIKLNKKSAAVAVGKKLQLKATVGGASNQPKWKSSNTKCASVNNSGVITAKKTGKITISATANGKTAKCTLTVKKMSKALVEKAIWNYVDKVYDMDTVNEYSGYLIFSKKKGDKYEFLLRSYTSAFVRFYVNAASGKITMSEQNLFTYEWEKAVEVGHVKDYL